MFTCPLVPCNGRRVCVQKRKFLYYQDIEAAAKVALRSCPLLCSRALLRSIELLRSLLDLLSGIWLVYENCRRSIFSRLPPLSCNPNVFCGMLILESSISNTNVMKNLWTQPVSIHKWSFCSIPVLCSKNNPRNIKYMPACPVGPADRTGMVIFFTCPSGA